MEFMASRNKVAWPRSTCQVVKAAAKSICGLGYIFLQPLIPYESGPTVPKKELPKEAGDVTGEQLMQCQSIFDDSEARRAHIEQKAQWLFTSIAFLMPALGSVLVFLIRDPEFRAQGCSVSLVILLTAACLLILCFIAASRAMAVRAREILHIHAVVDKQTGAFREYSKDFHAKGLLYCATMNTATNDHIAQFVRSAQVLLTTAVVLFVFGLIATVYDPWCPALDGMSEGGESCALTASQQFIEQNPGTQL